MTITQTVDIPENRRLVIEVPHEVPAGKARLYIQFPVQQDAQTGGTVPAETKGQISNDAFRNALSRAQGAWKDNPWLNHLEETRAMREEWAHRNQN